MRYLPRPFRANMTSTMIVPPISRPTLRPPIVISEKVDGRKACLSMILLGGRPFALAIVM